MFWIIHVTYCCKGSEMKVKMGWTCSLEGEVIIIEVWLVNIQNWGNNIKQDLRKKIVRM